MRKFLFALIASLAVVVPFSCGPSHVVVESPPPPPPAPPAEVSYQSFYDALSPYGEWINDPQYGYVWMPNAGPDFKPYATNGNWVYTDEGWTWASNYPWGWAPFHYGRWFFEEGYGWMWMPGNEWAPAWVSWRQSPQYYGWAPLGPSVSISIAAGGGYNPPVHYWSFVPQQYVTSPRVTNYYVNEQQNVTIINNTTIIHNTTIINNNTTIVNNRVNNTRVNNYAGGPDPGEVSRVTGVQLRPVAMRESNSPGENHADGAYAIYRPRVSATPQGNGGMAVRPAPGHVQTINNVRPVNTTIYTNNTSRSMPGNQRAASGSAPGYSQPGAEPAATPASPGYSQPGNQGAVQPGNQSGNPNRNNFSRTNPPKPAANPNTAVSNEPRNNGSGSNVNGHPGKPAGDANRRKPLSNQGQGTKAKRHQPNQDNSAHHS